MTDEVDSRTPPSDACSRARSLSRPKHAAPRRAAPHFHLYVFAATLTVRTHPPPRCAALQPLRLEAAVIVPDSTYQLCVRYEMAGQQLESEIFDIQTASAGPRATVLGATGNAEDISIWWNFESPSEETQYLVCVREADSTQPWGYLVAETVATEAEPFLYRVDGGLLPHTTYAVCIKVEQPDGSMTTSDVFTVLTDATAAMQKLAEEDQAHLKKQKQEVKQAAKAKHASLEDRLAKRRAAAAAKKAAAASS